jgi:uncharacterized protein (TIGR02118 family)
MVKIVFCLRRKDGMALEDFQRYWREEHAPLVQQHAGVLGILRYVQSHTRPGPEADLLRASRGGPGAYDGVAELWFRDTAALIEAASTPEGRAAGATLLEDERRFIDLAHSPIFLAEEHEVVGHAGGGGAPLGADTAWDGP